MRDRVSKVPRYHHVAYGEVAFWSVPRMLRLGEGCDLNNCEPLGIDPVLAFDHVPQRWPADFNMDMTLVWASCKATDQHRSADGGLYVQFRLRSLWSPERLQKPLQDNGRNHLILQFS
jgi:hypothetical protein